MEDYSSAALRHYEDAVLLFNAGKLDNSGHLIGFAAECAMKHVISSSSASNNAPHGHLPSFINIAKSHLTSRKRHGSLFNLLKEREMFKTWDVSRRYSHTGNTKVEELKDWHESTRRVLATVGLKAARK